MTPYSAVIVTFRRPDSLRDVLVSLCEQTHRPALIVVADNDPDRSAEPVLKELMVQGRNPAEFLYVPVGENLGPAGGWAAAVEAARLHVLRGEWVAIFDDDDGLTNDNVMRTLVNKAEDVVRDRPRVAALGLRGARISTRSAVLRRVFVADGETAVVDYLASGGVPIYKWTTIDQLGFFDGSLFFGFEDLELGLRYKAHNLELLVLGVPGHVVQDTSPHRTAWREYFKSRALVVISRRHLGVTATITSTARILAGAVRLLASSRRTDLFAARVSGVVDGFRDRLGAVRYVPQTNPAKPPVGLGDTVRP